VEGTEEGGVSARDTVLGKIRRSLGVEGTETERRAAVAERLRDAPRGVIPARGQLAPDAKVTLFVSLAEKYSASVARVANADAVPQAVAEYLRAKNLPANVRMGGDPLLADLPWDRTQIEVAHGPSDGNDAIGVSHALGGVAESGTLILASGPDNPTTLNFLPETHIVILKAAAIVGDYEAVWDRLREQYGKGVLPRTVNMVTGPSRSGDIEQKILLGAHGPRALHIVVVG
jgi:L-lactate dehydrogenase complex protein LldG